jgi:hypothetical protein
MKRLCLALAVAALLLLVAGVGTATAQTGNPDADQLVANALGLAGAGGTAQQQPTSEEDSAAAAPSPSDTSSTDQSNDASSNGTAGNLNATKQDADQEQGSSGIQAIGQSADNEQDATAAAATVQEKPSNTHTPVRVFSKGDGGDVTQSNDASSNATAGNLNVLKQDADQEQGGDKHEGNDVGVPNHVDSSNDERKPECGCESGGTQAIGQTAKSDQDATALAKTVQEKPSNKNISVRVLSPGDDGDVSQTNTASSDATAFNLNATKQDADQTQGGSCKCGAGEQAIGQSAKSDQDATALAKTIQEKPSNTNISVRVLSPGDDGDVNQANTATSDAKAGNINLTKQDADQEQDGSGVQAIGQSADNDQKALAASLTAQKNPSNKNISVRVLSPGDGGSVSQSNTASSDATAFNLNATKQDADQEQGGGWCKCTAGEQAIGQSAKSEQDAKALAATFQVEPSNTNTSVRVLSKGDDGDVTQSNDASSSAFAGNLNLTKQDADQEQKGDSCKCTGGIQAIGQSAKSEQDAKALAATFQVKPSNTNTPVRVLSKGDDGDVTQSNDASSSAFAGNLNATKQDADQKQEGGSGIQAIGQFAENDQDAFALGLTFQVGASNENTPVRIGSKGDSGDVTQSNTATSDAVAANLNFLDQDADQTQGGGKHDEHECCGTGIQAIGQFAKNDQKAIALAATFQIKPSNSNTPVNVGSDSKGKDWDKGKDKDKSEAGDVTQSNTASSDAAAFNVNLTKQDADQEQDTSCKCWEAFGIQAIGQLAKSDQKSAALAATFQLGASNTSAPVRVDDKKHGDDKGHDRGEEMRSIE